MNQLKAQIFLSDLNELLKTHGQYKLSSLAKTERENAVALIKRNWLLFSRETRDFIEHQAKQKITPEITALLDWIAENRDKQPEPPATQPLQTFVELPVVNPPIHHRT